MDAPAPTEEEARRDAAAWRWTKKIVGALALAVVTAAILGLAAITIGPHIFSYQALVVRSGSMSPTIPTGSVAFYRPVAATDVKVRDIIVFDKPGQANERVTHRVLSIGNGPNGRYAITKGDANGAADPWRVPLVGTGWREVWSVPVVGYVLFDIQSTYGRLLLLLVPAALLAAITLWEIWDGRRTGAPA